MNKDLYENFKQLRARHLRAEASEAMSDFLKSFASIEEKRTFTYWFFKNDFDGKKVRRDLYENVLFPALVEGYKTSDPWSIKTLAETEENLYEAKQLWSQIGYKTKLLLLRQYLELRPNDFTARRRLLTEQINSFRYCEQDWPSAIIYGQNAATETECKKLAEEITFARKLDKESKYKNYIDEFEAKLETYRKRFR
ncbi:MAG: hypothetical protein C5B53_08025 [Candidatus Melainabacteria bacterium]|nr:MAG: hypothetical protein C5B53_08025 [Candidatus Melainabacteria bacterium]